MLEASVVSFAGVVHETPTGGKHVLTPPLLSKTNFPLELLCAMCLGALRLPVTFADGSSVCRKCVSLKRLHLRKARSASSRFFPRDSDEGDDDFSHLEEIFGNALDVTVGTLCEAQPVQDNTALRLKLAGNTQFRAKHWSEAVEAYTKAMESGKSIEVLKMYTSMSILDLKNSDR
jgi:hypothetical protein